MTIIESIANLNPHAAAEITACLQPVRVGARTIRAVRRTWSVHDMAAIDLILRELGWRLTTINENVGAVDSNVEPLFQVVPVPPEEQPRTIGGYVPCETCGHWSSDIVEGMCAGCRRHFLSGNTGGDDGH